MSGAGQPGEEVTTGELAKRLGRTDECVRRWAVQGMPCRWVERDGQRYRIFDRAAAEAWVKANRGAGLHGGRRRGAGRKPGARAKREAASRIDFGEAQRRAHDAEAQREEALGLLRALCSGTLPEPIPAPATAPASDEAGSSVGGGARGRLPVDGLLSLTERELRVLAQLPDEVSGWTPNQATRLRQLHEARAKQMELEERCKRVVPVERVRAEARALAGRMVAAMDELVDHATRGVIEALGEMGAGHAESVRLAVERAVAEARQRLSDQLDGQGT